MRWFFDVFFPPPNASQVGENIVFKHGHWKGKHLVRASIAVVWFGTMYLRMKVPVGALAKHAARDDVILRAEVVYIL